MAGELLRTGWAECVIEMSQVNYYVRGGQVKEERGTQEQQEVQGSRLFIGEHECGGRWLEVGTDPRESQMVTMVQFRASKQLHFVDTHRHAAEVW